MARGDKKELTAAEIKKQAIHKMLEALISGNSEEAGKQLHEYLQLKTRELIVGESCEDKDDDDKDDEDEDEDEDDDKEDVKEAVKHHPDGAFSRKVDSKIKFDNGGKKTLKKHGNAPKELDDDSVGKTKFKSGGKQPAKTLEKTPKPEKFDDGRDMDLGTTK